jgi:hypothetical protein
VSQSHINNVLRGRRNLSHDVADLILRYFNFSLLDLYPEECPDNGAVSSLGVENHTVGVLKNAVGPGEMWSTALHPGTRYRLPAGAPLLQCSALARLIRDDSLAWTLCGHDIALLDFSIDARMNDSPSSLFVVVRGEEPVVRWIRTGSEKIYLAGEQSLNCPLEWERLAIPGQQLHSVIKAKIVWIGSESALQPQD